MFSIINSCIIKNLHLVNPDIIGESFTGGIYGYNDGCCNIIENCHVEGVGSVQGYIAGGIGGGGFEFYFSSITNCSVSIDNIIGHYASGGLIGSCDFGETFIDRCIVTTDISLIGLTSSPPPPDYYFDTGCGGLVGCVIPAGLVSIENSYYSGCINNERNYDENTGGLFGYIGYTTYGHCVNIRNCYALLDTPAVPLSIANYNTGGLIGYYDSNDNSGAPLIIHCYSVSTYNNKGLISKTRSYYKPYIINSYYQLNGNNIGGIGTVLTPQEMELDSSYFGWDFDEIWSMGNTVRSSTYPYPYYMPDWLLPNDPSQTKINIIFIELAIPQHANAKSRLLNIPGEEPDTGPNVCYDINNAYRAYANWPNMTINDFNNATGKAGTRADRVLRQAKVLITAKTGFQPEKNVYINISTTLGSDAWIHIDSTSSVTDSNGQITAYIEYFGDRVFFINAYSPISFASCQIKTTEAKYKNRFYLSLFYYPLRSKYATLKEFEAKVREEGTGCDDLTGKWYTTDWSSSANPKPIIEIPKPLTYSGTTPRKYITLGVDSPYIPRNEYVSDGSQNKVWHRGKIKIEGLGDDIKIAEDMGFKINGYHIDYFLEFTTVEEFANTIGKNLHVEDGYYFVEAIFVGIQKD